MRLNRAGRNGALRAVWLMPRVTRKIHLGILSMLMARAIRRRLRKN